MKFTVSIF